MSQITLAEQGTPTTPASGYAIIYPKSDGLYYSLNDAGSETLVSFVAATQAQQETASSVVVAVTPGRQQYHPSAVKAWGSAGTGGTGGNNFNISSITDVAVGKVRFNFTVSFSSGDYAIAPAIQQTDVSNTCLFVSNTTPPTSSGVTLSNTNAATAALQDPSAWFVMCSGDQ